MESGFISLGGWRGVPIRVHWSTPLGALMFSGLRFSPGTWAGFFFLVLAHELGHAYVVRRVGAEALEVKVMAMGGLCTWSGEVTAVQRACIAWGGIWAQMLVLLGTVIFVLAGGWPTSRLGAELVYAFTRSNLWLMALNLLPVPPLDGASAWRLPPLLVQRWRRARMRRIDTMTQRELQRRDELERRLNPEDLPPEAKEIVDQLLESVKDPAQRP